MLDYESIKSSVSITSVLARYAEAPPHGRSRYRIPCPLHGGVANNFQVDNDAGRWWCHVCHVGGDVINLVAAFEGCRNSEAAQKISEGFGLHTRIDVFTRTAQKTMHKLQEWQMAHEKPPPLDKAGVPATIDLDSYRNLSKEAISHFGLRLVPGHGWGEGVFIPMKLDTGEMVGYSIRHWDDFLDWFESKYDKKAPKYLNSAGLKKRGIMFGLHANKAAIKEAGFAYLCEGQFDCISLWDRGVKNVVGVMGSSLSAEQAQILMRYTPRIVLMFDGDEAGQAGAQQVKQRYGSLFGISSVLLPPGKDPASADLQELGVSNVVV